jgi:pimeloyl-ACP methyl ester carboxylesterase
MLDAYKVKHRTMAVGDATVFYREAGLADAPGVLLLHGFPSSSHIFRGVMPALAEVARVVAPDMPGAGFTLVPDSYTYTFANQGQTIDAFIKAVGLDRAGTIRISRSRRPWPVTASWSGSTSTSWTAPICCSKRMRPNVQS